MFLSPAVQANNYSDLYPFRAVDQEALSHDTVGAVARDNCGNIASGISTAGMCGMRDGRLGAGATLGTAERECTLPIKSKMTAQT